MEVIKVAVFGERPVLVVWVERHCHQRSVIVGEDDWRESGGAIQEKYNFVGILSKLSGGGQMKTCTVSCKNIYYELINEYLHISVSYYINC